MKFKTLRIMAIITGILGSTLFNRFLEGGALFMSLILICLLMSIYFMIKGFYKIKTNPELSKKMISLVNDSGTLGISLGFLSAFLGLIGAFDVLEATGNANPSIIAGGLKIALLSPIFGIFTFVISKIGVVTLKLLQKN